MRKMKINKGFEYKRKLYGWKDKHLYKLPQMVGLRAYGLRKCVPWLDKGYYLGQDRKSFRQLEQMTTDIDFELKINKHKDCPF